MLSGSSIKISARKRFGGFSEACASQQRFLKDHGLLDPPLENFFERMLLEGRLLSEIQLEHSSNCDDDWIMLSLSEADPAISPIVFRKA
jgi:hypothetical protein